MSAQPKYMVAIIGAGPAGLFAARELANQNVHVTLINRDIKPGGLAEYGIYPDKHRMKEGLRAQFRQVLSHENIHYYGNLTVGENADIPLAELRSMGFQAILVTAGAQATKWLGLPGENLSGVYHAKDLVYHYNQLPPFTQRRFQIGRKVAVVGAGNVMLDITHFLSTVDSVKEIVAVIRRGPAEIKFTKVELEHVARLLDLEDLRDEIARVSALMSSLDQNPQDLMDLIGAALSKADDLPSHARFILRFLASPTTILGDEYGRTNGLEVEENTLVLENGEVKARGLGSRQVLDVDTVIFAIGDRVDERFGIPVVGSEYAKNLDPRFPVEGISYEVFDPHTNCPIEGIFVAGWSRKASSGLVGVARKDGTNGARAVMQYLDTLSPADVMSSEELEKRLRQLPNPVITKSELAKLEEIEHQRAEQLGLEEFKFNSNQEMLEAVGLLEESLSSPEASFG